MNVDADPWGYPPQVIVRSVHGHDMALTVTVEGDIVTYPLLDEPHVRVTLSHGKHKVQAAVRDNSQVVSAAISKLATELATVLDRNQSRIKKIFG